MKVSTSQRRNAIEQAGACGKHFYHSRHKSAGTHLCISRIEFVEKKKKDEDRQIDRQEDGLDLVVHIKEITVNEDTWHGGIQATKCG